MTDLEENDQTPPREQYIGDGVYIQDHGWQYMLYTSNGISKTNIIWLEPNHIMALVKFMQKV